MELPIEEKLEEVFYDSTDVVEQGVISDLDAYLEPEISLHSISGSLSPNTMRLVALIKNQRVVILIDSRSTQNFLDPAVLKKLQFCVITTLKLQVNVANGAKIQSEGKCNSVSIKVQGNTISTDFNVIPLGVVILSWEWID